MIVDLIWKGYTVVVLRDVPMLTDVRILEWICQTCFKDNNAECDQKWEDILNYECIGVFKVLDDQTVSGSSRSHLVITLCCVHVPRSLSVPPVGVFNKDYINNDNINGVGGVAILLLRDKLST